MLATTFLRALFKSRGKLFLKLVGKSKVLGEVCQKLQGEHFKMGQTKIKIAYS